MKLLLIAGFADSVLSLRGALIQTLLDEKERGLDFRYALIGPGTSTDNVELVALLSEHGLEGSLRLLGQCNDISAVMNALDMHVLSSAFGEAFPNVLAEVWRVARLV